MIEAFPPELLTVDAKERVILMLQALPIPQQAKKEALIQWCRYVGVALTKEMVDRVLNPLLPGNVR